MKSYSLLKMGVLFFCYFWVRVLYFVLRVEFIFHIERIIAGLPCYKRIYHVILQTHRKISVFMVNLPDFL